MYLVLGIHSKRGYTPKGQKRESHVVSLHPLYTIESTESGNEKEEKELTRRNFLPDAGRLIHTRAPVDIPHRLETGFWEGDEISSYYDPMVRRFSPSIHCFISLLVSVFSPGTCQE